MGLSAQSSKKVLIKPRRMVLVVVIYIFWQCRIIYIMYNYINNCNINKLRCSWVAKGLIRQLLYFMPCLLLQMKETLRWCLKKIVRLLRCLCTWIKDANETIIQRPTSSWSVSWQSAHCVVVAGAITLGCEKRHVKMVLSQLCWVFPAALCKKISGHMSLLIVLKYTDFLTSFWLILVRSWL